VEDHLLTLDHLKEGIGLARLREKDPLVEFKKEAFTLFEDMMGRIDTETVRYLFLVQRPSPKMKRAKSSAASAVQQQEMQYQAGAAQAEEPNQFAPARKSAETILALLGSGKKYKKVSRNKRHRFLGTKIIVSQNRKFCS